MLRKLLLLTLLALPLHSFALDTCTKSASAPNNSSIPDGYPVSIYCDANGNVYTTSGSSGGGGGGTVTQGPNGSAAAAWFEQQVIAGAIVSATNGGYTNLLQGNAVLSSGNPLPAQLFGTLPAFAATPTFNLGTLGGAATAANQPTNAAQASTTSGQTGILALGATTTSAPSETTGQTNPLSLTTAGAVRVDGSGVTQPVSGTITQSYSGTPTQTSVSCATTTTALLAAAAATTWEHFESASTNTNNVWINVAGASATTGAGNLELQPGQSADFLATTFLPTSAINCIASTGATSLTVIYK